MELLDLFALALLIFIAAALLYYAIRQNRCWFIRGAILAAVTVLVQLVTNLL